MRYSPVLKAKAAELNVLTSEMLSSSIEPIFELLPGQAPSTPRPGQTPTIAKSTPTETRHFLDAIDQLWGGRYYADVRHIVSGVHDLEAWWTFINAGFSLTPPAAWPVPVVRLEDVVDIGPAFAHAASRAEGLAIRIKMPVSPSIDLPDTLTGVSARTTLPVQRVDLILDWANDVENYPLDFMEKQTAHVIARLVNRTRRISVIGTLDDSDVAGAGTWTRDRREWWTWLRLHEAGWDVDFGDYALYAPKPPGFARPTYGHLRYSYGDKVRIDRFDSRSAGSLKAAFTECCRTMHGSGVFCGDDHCVGDRRIGSIVLGEDSTGGAGQWREISFRHHIRLVDEQLTIPPSSPALGTT